MTFEHGIRGENRICNLFLLYEARGDSTQPRLQIVFLPLSIFISSLLFNLDISSMRHASKTRCDIGHTSSIYDNYCIHNQHWCDKSSITSLDLTGVIEKQFRVLPESTAVIVHTRPRIPECLQQRTDLGKKKECVCVVLEVAFLE